MHSFCRVEVNPVPRLGVGFHENQLKLMLLEVEDGDQGHEYAGRNKPGHEGQTNARPGHHHFVGYEMRTAREISGVTDHLAACGMVLDGGRSLAETDIVLRMVFSHALRGDADEPLDRFRVATFNAIHAFCDQNFECHEDARDVD